MSGNLPTVGPTLLSLCPAVPAATYLVSPQPRREAWQVRGLRLSAGDHGQAEGPTDLRKGQLFPGVHLLPLKCEPVPRESPRQAALPTLEVVLVTGGQGPRPRPRPPSGPRLGRPG